MKEPVISIDRSVKQWAIFDQGIDLIKPFEPYTSEEEAIRLGREFLAGSFPDAEPARVVYPRIDKMVVTMRRGKPRRMRR